MLNLAHRNNCSYFPTDVTLVTDGGETSITISLFIVHPQIPEVYTPVLERLLVVQIDSFPQYSVRMQPTCTRAIVKVLVAMASKGPVFWSFISSVGELKKLSPTLAYNICHLWRPSKTIYEAIIVASQTI